MATTAPSIFRARVSETGMIAAASLRVSASSRPRSGHISTVMTVPTTAILTRPLVRLASACLEKMRLRPASGEIFDSFGARV